MRFLLRLFAVLRRGELLYTADYDRKCRIRLPGDYESWTTMHAGDKLRVYVIRANRG